MASNPYEGNLSSLAKLTELRVLLAEPGEVKSGRVVDDHESRRSDTARGAISVTNGKTVDDRRPEIDPARFGGSQIGISNPSDSPADAERATRTTRCQWTPEGVHT